MRIVVKDIPNSVLFFNSDSTKLYEIHLNFEGGRVKDPLLCRRQDTKDPLEEVERNYKRLLSYISDLAVRRLLIESMIIDATIEIALYENEIRSSTPQQLTEEWGCPDDSKWWTVLYPTRLSFLEEKMRVVQIELKTYERMLED